MRRLLLSRFRPATWLLFAVASLCAVFISKRQALAQAEPIVGNLSGTISQPHADFQVWPELDLRSTFGSRIDATLESQGRFSLSLPNPEVYVFGSDINITATKHFILTPSYYYYRFDEAANAVGYGHNAILAATIQGKYRGFSLGERNRFVGVFSEAQKFWVYGNRIQIQHQVGPSRNRNFLFAWDELFYFSDTHAWQRNRLEIGFHKYMTRRVAVEPYYLHQTDGHSRPGETNNIGLTLQLRVR